MTLDKGVDLARLEIGKMWFFIVQFRNNYGSCWLHYYIIEIFGKQSLLFFDKYTLVDYSRLCSLTFCYFLKPQLYAKVNSLNNLRTSE